MEEKENDNTESFPLYCMDCGQMLDRADERCFSCGAYQ